MAIFCKFGFALQASKTTIHHSTNYDKEQVQVMSIKKLLHSRFQTAMQRLEIPSECSPLINQSNKPEFGDYQANGAMGAAKKLNTNPRDLAQKLLEQVDLGGIAAKTEIAGPGFINVTLCNDFLSTSITECLTQPSRNIENIVIDYSGPNLAKEMHVGHLRSTIIGDAIARILEYQGQNVIRQNHMGDWGTQFGMLIAELELQLNQGEQAELALSDLEVFYQQSKKHFDADPEFADKARENVVKLQSGDKDCLKLWEQFITVSIAHNTEIYKQLNVGLTSQHIMPESAYNKDLSSIIDTLTSKQLAVESDGAKVVFLEELADKNGEPSPMIVQKSDGGFLYATTDLAAIKYRAEQLKADRILYFIDARQSLHMKQVFIAGKKADFVSDQISLEHHAFGTMMGKDGKPFKTRTGGTVKLADLLNEAVDRAEKLVAQKNNDLNQQEIQEISRKVGIGAVKYADLCKTRTNDYIFDWDSMLSFEGNTAPYLQYAYTRICSIFRKAELDRKQFSAMVKIAEPQEKQLALKLLQFNEVVEQVATDCYPHTLCSYLYELASLFMSFYEHCPILKSDVPSEIANSRLQISAISADVLSQGLDLLGIEVMEKM